MNANKKKEARFYMLIDINILDSLEFTMPKLPKLDLLYRSKYQFIWQRFNFHYQNLQKQAYIWHHFWFF